MNSKMTINTYLSTTEKNKLSKQEEQGLNHGYGKCMDGCQMWGWFGVMGEKVRGLRSTNW